MNTQEAYNLLEISEDISDDDLKKHYKKLAIKYHPDKYEDKDKFKLINEAYQLITDHRENPHKHQQQNPFQNVGGFGINLNDILNGFQRSQQNEINSPPIQLRTKISFKESVLGVEKEVSYKKNIKCDDCNGNGKETISNGCSGCNGFGRVVQTQGNMQFSTGCGKCHGRNVKFKNCDKCNAKGYKELEVNAKINVPPGNASTLRIRGAGSYVGSNGFGDAYSDVFLQVEIENDRDLRLEGADVIFNLKLPLIQALTGCSKEVKTIYGYKTIDIPRGSKHKEELKIDGYGIKQMNGIQKTILDVDYGDIDRIIDLLK